MAWDRDRWRNNGQCRGKETCMTGGMYSQEGPGLSQDGWGIWRQSDMGEDGRGRRWTAKDHTSDIS